ncbi:MAG TPA: protein kinase [Ktedonobacteraceae bacterium]|nr:protein kinase [Ktedonobacteraceae bacterium]
MPRCLNPRCRADNPAGSVVCAHCECLLPGAMVAGRYRVESLLGLGGMGAVYRADDTFEVQQVALKVISTRGKSMDELTAQERFRREARYAHQLQHRNIVPVHNFGKDGTLLYLVMPLVTGGTLKGLLKNEKPLPVEQARRYLNDLAEAIDAVHAHPQQIVHRDIKPSNLLIHQDDGRLVLADFGIARAMQQESPLTQRGWAVGTEHYIAPEQEAGSAEPSSDIYSMGVVAYQMFTGLLPFQAVVRNRVAEIPPPSTLNPALPAAIDPVIMRAMEVEPAKRYPSARVFADAVNEALKTTAPSVGPSLSDMPTLPISSSALPPPVLPAPQGQAAINSANIMVRLLVPENACSACGQENRPASRFCRRCGHSLNDTAPVVVDACQIGFASDPGRLHVSEVNEDMLLVAQGLCSNLTPPPRPYGLFAVADGLRRTGKTASGHEASRLAIETVADVLLPQLSTPLASGSLQQSSRVASGTTSKVPAVAAAISTPQDSLLLEQWLRESVRRANQVIYHCNDDFGIEMASTLAVALVYKYHLYVANVGDCRVYHYRANRGMQLITKDHTLAANLVEAELFTPDELYKSAKRNQHYRYLGQATPVQVDFFQQELKVGDLVLLCSDGLWHMLRDERLQELLVQGQNDNLQSLARTFVDAANLAGGEGNVSAIVVKVQ